ncbi:hypothetical protein BDV38DRAFT_276800 [Aspergillus pseudotamarii]|uniref:Uncharacterized protein n=1 Tax=Aspergillus pseudotamarii TaxID=132259 RepID=A0A5N6TC31_ASPPS|nr:uncharacterized protein BDV38DRAFT_276800 [Aspergillus pseudotamarii]KAE8143719.1 hypothetical protein BDV38DRAFT_276800 [Aspergillus pseudotamarii]
MSVLASTVLQRGKGIQVGERKNIWHSVHVHDLSEVYLAQVEAAVASAEAATWGKERYYLVENGHFVWGEAQLAIARVEYEKGMIETCKLDVLDFEQTAWEHMKGPYRWDRTQGVMQFT